MDSHIRVEERQEFNLARSVSPVPHQLACHGEHGEDLHAGSAHAVVRVVRSADVECSRRISVGEDRVARISERKCEESSTDLT